MGEGLTYSLYIILFSIQDQFILMSTLKKEKFGINWQHYNTANIKMPQISVYMCMDAFHVQITCINTYGLQVLSTYKVSALFW